MSQEYYGEERRRYNKNRSQYRLAMGLISGAPQSGKVLDAGSGLGEFLDLLVKQGYDVIGVEGVEEFVIR